MYAQARTRHVCLSHLLTVSTFLSRCHTINVQPSPPDLCAGAGRYTHSAHAPYTSSTIQALDLCQLVTHLGCSLSRPYVQVWVAHAQLTLLLQVQRQGEVRELAFQGVPVRGLLLRQLVLACCDSCLL